MSKSEAASLALTATKKTIGVGSSYDFNIKNKVKGSTYKWTSSNTKVATVNSKNGLTTAKKEGTAKISVKITLPKKAGTKTLTATVTVKKYVDATSVKISNPVTAMEIGAKHDFNRTMSPEGANNKTYWIVMKDGKEIANTRTGVGADLMSSKGVFHPTEGGVYTIKAECWRSKTATVKRAESDVLTVQVGKIAASQSGVRTIKVAGATSEAVADYTVKRGNASVSIKDVTVKDGNAYLTTVATKMVAGEYSVAYNGTTSVFQAEDEKLTSLQFTGTELVKENDKYEDTSKATIGFKALNQFGEMMAADVSASATFTVHSIASPTATKAGSVTVVTGKNLIGTTGSVVLVDKKTGVNTTATVVIGNPATPKTVEVLGVYNTVSEKYEDLKAGASVDDYVILTKVKDQYGKELNSTVLTNENFNVTITAGLTNVTKAALNDIEINGTKYVGIALTGSKIKAGTFNMTIVNNRVGLLANQSFTVAEATVIKTFNVSANGSIYNKQDNELYFEAVDQNGNSVTDVKVLNDLVKFDGGNVSFSQKSGSTKLIYAPDVAFSNAQKNNETTTEVLIAKVNDQTSTNYRVSTFTLTVYEERVPNLFNGINKDKALSVVAKSGEKIEIKMKDLLVEDQYGNIMTEKELADCTLEVAADPAAGNTSFSITDAANVVTATANGTPGSDKATLVLKKSAVEVSRIEVTFTATAFEKISNFEIKALEYEVEAGESVTADGRNKIVVIGKSGGKTVVIPESQYTVTGGGTAPELDDKEKTSKTATLEVTVDTLDGKFEIITREYTYSNKDSEVKTLKVKTDADTTISKAGNVLSKDDFVGLFEAKDQYGKAFGMDTVKYELLNPDKDMVTVVKNNTNDISVTVNKNYDVRLIARLNGLSAEVVVTLEKQ